MKARLHAPLRPPESAKSRCFLASVVALLAVGSVAACSRSRPAPVAAGAPAGSGIEWTLSPERIATTCQAEI